jgi:hypothetical protein
MGEANNRATIEGSLTKRMLVTLGSQAIRFGRTEAKQGGAGEGQTGARQKKRKAQEQFGIAWVEEQVDERANDPAFEGKRMFDKEQMTSEEVRVSVDRDVLAWVLDELDKVPAGSAEDVILGKIEERLQDMKRGTYAMPAVLLAPQPTNGITFASEEFDNTVTAPSPQ